MNDTNWTPSLVEEWLVEAADILKRLPSPRVQGFYSLWPNIAPSFDELVGQTPRPMSRAWPAPDAITRMEETLSWTIGLDPVDAKIIWLRAFGERWKTICSTVGLQRASAHEHWVYARCVIALRLNGREIPGKRSRSDVIAMVRGANR